MQREPIFESWLTNRGKLQSSICKGIRILAQSFSCKKLSNQKHAADTVRNTRKRTPLCWMRCKIKELLFIKLTLYLSLSFRNLSFKKTRQNILPTKNSQEFLASQVSVLRRNKATNSSTSNCLFFSCTESPCNWWFIQGY